MNSSPQPTGKWAERTSVSVPWNGQNDGMFELFFERSADAIWLFDPKAGVFVDCNQAAVELMRADRKEQLLRMRPEDLSPPNQPDGIASELKAAQMTEISKQRDGHRFEWVARRCDGELVPLEVLATPIATNGHTLHAVVSRDITERKKSEAALRESQQLLASVADNISEAVYRTGPNHELIFANRAYLRLSGYHSLEEMQRIPREQLYGRPEDRALLLKSLEREGYFRNLEIEYVRRDGH